MAADINHRHVGKQNQREKFRKFFEEGSSLGPIILFHANLTHVSGYFEGGMLAPPSERRKAD